MSFKSINPYTEECIFQIEKHSDSELRAILKKAKQAQSEWANVPVSDRIQPLHELSSLLKSESKYLSTTITTEMGKPIDQAESEVEKCAWLCDYYFQNAESQLSDIQIQTEAKSSYVHFDPLGILLAVMPWNFPFWQFFRAAVPALCAGNAVLLKHASNVPQCAISIEKIFVKAGFPEGLVSNLFVGHENIEHMISDDHVDAVTLTGSEKAGSSIGSIAGKHIKKCVMELGGNDAFIVFPDADFDQMIEKAVTSRMQNNGQSCIAAKRFIVHKSIYNKFLKEFTQQVSELTMGDPMSDKTDIGPIARDDLAYQIKVQINHSELKGAKIHFQHENVPEKGFFVSPTILTDVSEDMPAFDEEIFGPVASVIEANDENEALKLANRSIYGLGASVWTNDEKMIDRIIPQIQAGNVMVNEIVKSDPRLPFGGIKRSGFGRELGEFGIREFVNIKTVQRY